jgi:predicted TIM-barrel fold metal-dependent hydrolase
MTIRNSKRSLRALFKGAGIIASLFAFGAVNAQDADLKLLDWKPKSMMVVKETKIMKPKFPVIDIHNHLRNLEKTEYYLEQMDEAGVYICIGLDGHSKNDFYKKHLEVSQSVSKERFHIYFSPDFSKIDEPNFGEKEAKKLEEAVGMGIRGLKIFKSLGLGFKDKSGNFISVDDPRIDPIWAKCGELGIPVMIHVSDPKAFHECPVDYCNERYDELAGNPEWSFYGDEFPSKMEILEARNRVIERHPNTIFIGAHMGNLPEELGMVSIWLEKYPNFYVDINARISELGRQPYTARRFMIQYQDRILFGTDTPPNAESYRVYYRFLETDDEYFDPTPAHKLQGRWMIYGLYLPDEVLEKIYNKNALKIMSMYKGPK